MRCRPARNPIPLSKADIAKLIILVGREMNPDDFETEEVRAIIHKCKAIMDGGEWVTIRL